MEGYLINNFIFLITSTLFFHLITYGKKMKLKDSLYYFSFVYIFVVPLTLKLESYVLFNYIADSEMAAAFVAPLEEITKLIPIIILIIAKRHKLKNVLDYIFIGAISGIGFTVIENLFYKRAMEGREFLLGISSRTYLNYGISFSHIISTVLVAIFIGLMVCEHKSKIRKLIYILGGALSLSYTMFEHSFYNSTLANSLFGIIEYNPANMASKIHNITGKNFLTPILVIIGILFICYRENFKEKGIKEFIREYKSSEVSKRKVNKKVGYFLASILVIALGYLLFNGTAKEASLLDLLESGFLEELLEWLKIAFMICAVIVAFSVSPITGITILTTIVNPFLGVFFNTKLGKAIENKLGKETTNAIICSLSIIATIVGLVVSGSILFDEEGIKIIIGLLGLGSSGMDFATLIKEFKINDMQKYVDDNIKKYQGFSDEFVVSMLTLAVSTGIIKGPNGSSLEDMINKIPMMDSAIHYSQETLVADAGNSMGLLSERSDMDNGYDEIRMAVSEYVYDNLEDFQYYKLGDTWSMDKVSEEYKFISNIKENMESSMEIDMGNIIDKGFIPGLPTDEKIVLASMVLGADKYESYDYEKGSLLYDHTTGAVIITDKAENILDIQVLPKAFIYNILGKQINKEELKDVVDSNIEALENNLIIKGELFTLISLKNCDLLSSKEKEHIEAAINSLDKERYNYELEDIRRSLAEGLLDILGCFNEESYEYSESYRLNKIASLTKSDNAELVRDYIDFSLEYIAYLDDILDSELDMVIKTQLNQVTEAYRQRASLGFKKFVDFVVPYRLINK